MRETRHRNISDRIVDALKVKYESVLWDRRRAGFGVRAHPCEAKPDTAQAQGPRDAKRVTLDHDGVIQAQQTRRRERMAGEGLRSKCTAARKANGPTVAEVASRYLNEYVIVRCKPSTVQLRGILIRKHIVPAIGHLPLVAVGREEIADLHQQLAATPVNANMAISTLSQIFNKAQIWGIVPEGINPCRHMPLYKRRKRERFLTEAEFARLGQVLEDALQIGGAMPQTVAAIRLLMLTGCRKREILTLRWADVDVESPRIAPAGFKGRTTGGAAVAVCDRDSWPAYRRLPGNEWVFPGQKSGTHLCSIDLAWRRLRARADLSDVRLHDLRHSFASSALALGESLPTIQKLLGHKRISSTVRYAHLARATVHEAANRVADSLAEDIL